MCFGGTVLAAPQATVAIAGGDLDFTFEDPQRLTVTLPGSTEPATYWYMLYQVTNNTGKDQQFFPSFSLVTDELEVVQGGSDIDPRVYDIIAARHDKAFPFNGTAGQGDRAPAARRGEQPIECRGVPYVWRRSQPIHGLRKWVVQQVGAGRQSGFHRR